MTSKRPFVTGTLVGTIIVIAQGLYAPPPSLAFGLGETAVAPSPNVKIGQGCTTAWYIDEDCDGYGVGVRSSGTYGGQGLGDRPDADDADAAINTPASVLASYDANRNATLEAGELKAFLSAHKGVGAKNIYYISPTGNNSTGAVNDPSRPYASYSSPGVTQYLTPGDVVIYRGGTYTEPYIGYGAPYPAMKSGTAGVPIVVMTAPGERVVFNAASIAIDTTAAHDLIIDGFAVDNPSNTGLGYGVSFAQTSRAIWRNLEVQRFSFISSMQDIHDVTVDRWVIHDNAEHGLYLGSRELPNSNITVQHSLIYHNGIALEYGGFQHNGRVTNLRVDGNIIHSNGQWGISLKMGVTNSVFQNNLIFNNQGHGIIFDIYPGDCSIGICPYSQTGNLITNNTLWIGKYDQSGVVPLGNTPAGAAAVLVARNVGSPGDGKDQGKNIFQNNIFVTYNGPAFRYTSAEWLDTTTIQNNVLYRVGGPDALVLYGGTTYSFTSFQSTFALAGKNAFTSPLFSSANIDDWSTPGTFDLSLVTGSPAIAFGVSLGAPTYDLRGTSRTTSPSAGAYELATGSSTTIAAPATPTNVRIIR